MEKILYRGAESIVYLKDSTVIKDRIKKNYRINEIDDKLRSQRNRKESKLIEKAVGIAPKLINVDDRNKIIEMEYIEGEVLRDVLDKLDDKEKKKILNEVGKNIALLHGKDIIHGDLTTTNMIVKNEQVFFVDFGLGFISKRIEDKAVDLHLMREALESKHYKHAEECFDLILEGYKNYSLYREVVERYKKVEQRGRYKRKQQLA